jgi:hypothetical protein
MFAAVDQAIEAEAFDWLRYSYSCYLVWTPSDAETICRKILRVPGMESSWLFICAIDVSDGFGFLPTAAWEWIRRDRGNGPLSTWTPPPPDPPGLPDWLPTGNIPPLLTDKLAGSAGEAFAT